LKISRDASIGTQAAKRQAERRFFVLALGKKQEE
jgi:hypothetical protein